MSTPGSLPDAYARAGPLRRLRPSTRTQLPEIRHSCLWLDRADAPVRGGELVAPDARGISPRVRDRRDLFHRDRVLGHPRDDDVWRPADAGPRARKRGDDREAGALSGDLSRAHV